MHRWFILLVLLVSPSVWAATLPSGQLLYVPVYSHIYTGNQQRPFHLTVTLAVRNTDPHHSIKLVNVDYYDSKGRMLRQYLKKTVSLAPLEATEFVINEEDSAGGSGASFLVRWNADGPVNVPVVESVMIGASGSQGISFTSPARVVEE